MTLKELANRIDKSDSNKLPWECYVRSLFIELGLPGLDATGIDGVEAYWFRKLHIPQSYEPMYTGSAILFYKNIPICYFQVIDLDYDPEVCEYIPVCDFECFDTFYPKMLVEHMWSRFAERKEYQTTSLTVPMKDTYTVERLYQLNGLELEGATVRGKRVYRCEPVRDESSEHYGWMMCTFSEDGPYEYVPLNQFDIPIRLDK